jgi:hypothetical protein
MNIKTLLIALLSSLLYSASGQSNDPDGNYKRDVGFNTVFILQGVFNSNSTPFSLMYKKYTSDNRALRFGTSININLNRDNPSNNSTSNYSKTSYASISAAFGKEFQKLITTKWTWYYGGDLIPSFYSDEYLNYQNGNKYSENKTKSYGLSVRPFLGIRFALNPRLYLSAEANLSLGYTKGKVFQKYFDPENIVIDNDNTNYSVTASPASGIFIFYRF